MNYPLVKDLTITAESILLDTVPMPSTDRADRELLPTKISVKYWPTPEGWRIWSMCVTGPSVLKDGNLGKSTRIAYYGLRSGIDTAPDWVREFAAAHVPAGGPQ